MWRVFCLAAALPFPRQHFMEAGGRQVCDAGKDIGEPGLGVHVIQPCGHDEGEHDGGPVCAAVGTGEEPCLSAASHRPFILPMSAKSERSTIVGIPISAGRLSCGG